MIEYGLLGGRLGHSYSAILHKMLADYRYELVELDREHLDTLMRERGFRGVNVTIPYKETVLPYCDELDADVREVGSANTLVVGADGKLRAHNTDLFGAKYMLDSAGISLKGRKVAILGSGGTSLTMQALCRREGAREYLIVSRRGDVNYETLCRDHRDIEVLINATPVGMYPENGASPLDLSLFEHLVGVADVIYNPLRTRLMQQAQEMGIPCVGGLGMLTAQAARAVEWFTGEKVAPETIDRVLRKLTRSVENVVLIGMPGCGKTTIGQILAQRMGRTLVDLDEEVVRTAGMSIPELFAQRGEEAFRRLETETARRFGKEKSLVISVGGGCVMREENVRALSQNGTLVHVTRPLEQLSTEGRPLSAGGLDALRAMAEKRMPVYARVSGLTVANEGTPEEAVQFILSHLENA